MADVTSVLAKHGSGNSQHCIKPDLTREDRLIESVLLRKRWDLMTSDIPKKDIKLGRSSLFVKRSLHGRVVNGSYTLQSSTSTTRSPCAESMLINTTSSTTTSASPSSSNNDPNAISPGVGDSALSRSSLPTVSPTTDSVAAAVPESSPPISN